MILVLSCSEEFHSEEAKRGSESWEKMEGRMVRLQMLHVFIMS